MESYIEYLNKRVMDQAYDIGYLRGTLKGILNLYSERLPGYILKDIREVLKVTESGSETSGVPVEHNGATQVEVTGGIVGDE